MSRKSSGIEFFSLKQTLVLSLKKKRHKAREEALHLIIKEHGRRDKSSADEVSLCPIMEKTTKGKKTTSYIVRLRQRTYSLCRCFLKPMEPHRLHRENSSGIWFLMERAEIGPGPSQLQNTAIERENYSYCEQWSRWLGEVMQRSNYLK